MAIEMIRVTSKTMNEFAKAFRSTWVTARRKGITAKDVETEIAEYRKR